ncbi:MAG: trypsin-like peptidase domain-containing protein [Planctomycetes bacterium]|nr:trypsin-like peptidase domain-containing protein [Planctomycetota bacterium]
MPTSTKALAAAALLLALFTTTAAAQTIDPVGRIHKEADPLHRVAALAVPALDRLAIAQDDEQRHTNGEPPRYAMPFATRVSPTTHGTWQALDANWSLWRLRIQAPNASHVNLGFEHFHMPAGARMQVYSADYADICRPFDVQDHAASGELWTPVVQGAEIVCEVYVPTAAKPQVQLDLVQVGSGYRFFGAGPTALDTDASGSCNVDVACPAAAPWASEIPAIAAISSGGSIFCTGCMINNTAQDGRNFFLTAYHCGVTSGAAPSLVCYWNYQRTGCGTGTSSLSQFTTGAVLRASYSTSDFTLVELNSTPNPAWGVTYAGWSNAAVDASSAVAIHHPSGDVKKISWENQPTTTTSYLGTAVPGDSTHVRITDWDTGTTEPGSSGSPLFDQDHHIIGQLHGGYAACGNNSSDWYGRFARSWTGGGSSSSRLSNWLDPLGTGQLTLNTLGAGDVAVASTYGVGCYTSYGAFGEEFAANSFDFGGSATTTRVITLTPASGALTVQNAGLGAWFTPTSGDLNLGDDAVSTQALPWTWTFPGGGTNAVRMCSNGFVWLNGTSTDTDYTPSLAELAAGPARLAPMWCDLNPGTGSGSGGTCHYDVDPSGTAVYFTWLDVPAYGGGSGNSFQLALYQSGAAQFRYRQVPNQADIAVVGFSRGAAAVPPSVDLTTALPLTVSSDASGLTWTPVNRPLLGALQVITLGNIPNPAGSIGVVMIGFASIPGGFDLASIGAGGCDLYLNMASLQPVFPLLGSAVNWTLPIPNVPTLSGTSIFTQGALLVPPGTNAFGALTANGVELKMGTL